MRGRPRLVMALLAVTATAAGWLYLRTAQTRPPQVTSVAPSDEARQRIERRMGDDVAFRNDVAFLLVATLRDRCRPAEAGLLARMANRAALPVLAAVSAVTAEDPGLDRPIYRYIQHRADSARCTEPLPLAAAGGRVLHVDIEQYARTFPDSYFDPARSREPPDFGGQTLRERASNACNSVVYSVLPLGGADWRCASLRANARARVRGLCEHELRRQHGDIGGELDMAVGQGMQEQVVAVVAALPVDCR
ncbi:hypothetical protein ROV84_01290 [Stenotrophomonas maltophilia]|nr:hypothetical protein [Stenotrophomonas maltophilia]MDT3499576.1 hypothetical protein [Stenotrophomonas maltophilia]